MVSVVPPVSDSDIEDRKKQYDILDTKKFATRYNNLLFTPIQFDWNGATHQIQFNFCTDPFCKWFGRDQERFEKLKTNQVDISSVAVRKVGVKSLYVIQTLFNQMLERFLILILLLIQIGQSQKKLIGLSELKQSKTLSQNMFSTMKGVSTKD